MAITTILAGVTISAGDVVQVVHYNWCNAQYGLCGYALKRLTGSGAFSCGDVAWGMQTTMSALLCLNMYNGVFLLGARVQRLSTDPPGQAGVATDTTIGTAGVTPLATQTSGIVSLFANGSGPSERGRMFIPFPCSDDMDATTAQPGPAYVTRAADIGNELIGDFNLTSEDTMRTASFRCVIWHRENSTSSDVVAAAARPYWGTQRRRSDIGKQNPKYIPY
jgi:hypothetical protein